jgi:hypothetical protein
MHSKQEKLFRNRKFVALAIALIITMLIDTSVVKINDLIDKFLIPLTSKLILFSVNTALCLILQFLILRYVSNSFRDRSIKSMNIKTFYFISLASLAVVSTLAGYLIFQIFYYGYYETWVSISIVVTGYGMGAAMVIWLSFLFFRWYRSSHGFVILLYFLSTALISFNLILTAAFVSVKLNDTRDQVGEYVGSSGDLSAGRHQFLNSIYRISSFMSFFSIWLTTAILMNSYREKLSIINLIILSIPLVYFFVTYFYQFTLGTLLTSYLEIDPVTASIILGIFLALSKPIGGLMFGLAFWKTSKILGYEKNISKSMIIAGWGIFFIFSANQAATQIISPYPPFGLATVAVLNLGSYLMLLGIYNSAILVSANNSLRKFIHKHALKLLNPIGQAEMQKEIQRTVKIISDRKDIASITTETSLELDEEELKKYLHNVIKEVKKIE